MARRAGFLGRLRTSDTPLLVIFGPAEFAADAPPPVPGTSFVPPAPADALTAYSRLNAQAVYLSSKAAAYFEPAGKLPASFMLVQDKARTRVIDYSGRKVGVVFFPALESFSGDDALTMAMAEALRAGRELAGQVHLLVGVSPWGNKVERFFLPQAEGVFHILLGGGDGYGFPFAVAGQGGLLWSRPEADGRSVNLIKLLEWPSPGGQLWQPQVNFESSITLLGPQIPSDSVINGLFPEPESP